MSEFQVEKIDDIILIKPLMQILDVSVASSFKNEILDHIQSGHEHIVLDFSNIKLIDSSGLGSLLAVYKALDEKNNLHIFGVNSQLMKLLEITNLHILFHFYGTKEEALNFKLSHP